MPFCSIHFQVDPYPKDSDPPGKNVTDPKPSFNSISKKIFQNISTFSVAFLSSNPFFLIQWSSPIRKQGCNFKISSCPIILTFLFFDEISQFPILITQLNICAFMAPYLHQFSAVLLIMHYIWCKFHSSKNVCRAEMHLLKVLFWRNLVSNSCTKA